MTTREYRTLREILEYNDRVLRLEVDQNGLPQDQTQTQNINQPKRFTIHKTSLLSVLNWDAIYSNNKLFTCMMLLIITVLSQLVFSYVAFALVNVQENIYMFYLSQALNLICSYVMPLALIQDLDEVLENPFSELSKEIEIFRKLRHCAIAQSVCCVISLIAVIKVFRGGSLTEIRYNPEQGIDIPLDMTVFVKILQLISFQLTLINLILVLTNLYLTSRKIRYCFNRVERMQSPSDIEAMFNSESVDHRFTKNFF